MSRICWDGLYPCAGSGDVLLMFQLQPVGSVAHIQICGTTSCMICGAEELIAVCKELVAPGAHQVSADGKFSWEEVECMGACTNAPMAQIGKDYYEDLTADKLRALIGRFSNGEAGAGAANGRCAEPCRPDLAERIRGGRKPHNASAQNAVDIGDTIKRIDGTEVPRRLGYRSVKAAGASARREPKPAAMPAASPQDRCLHRRRQSQSRKLRRRPRQNRAASAEAAPVAAVEGGNSPKALKAPRKGVADDLQKIEGIGPVLEKLCHGLGIFHFDQIAAFGPAEVAWMDGNLKGFRGRVSRDKWVAQAKLIGEIGLDAFLIRAKTNDY